MVQLASCESYRGAPLLAVPSGMGKKTWTHVTWPGGVELIFRGKERDGSVWAFWEWGACEVSTFSATSSLLVGPHSMFMLLPPKHFTCAPRVLWSTLSCPCFPGIMHRHIFLGMPPLFSLTLLGLGPFLCGAGCWLRGGTAVDSYSDSI